MTTQINLPNIYFTSMEETLIYEMYLDSKKSKETKSKEDVIQELQCQVAML